MNARVGLACVLFALLLVPACDTIEGETVSLDIDDIRFTFRCGGSGQSCSGALASDGSYDLGGDLQGFAKEEIVAARLTSATLARVQPSGSNLDQLMSSLELALSGGGATQVVGAQDDLPAARTTPLVVIGTSVPVQIVRAPSFTARLDPVGLPSGQSYVFDVELTLSLELEGL